MKKISGRLLASITKFIKKANGWNIKDPKRYAEYILDHFQMCSICNKPNVSHHSLNLPFFHNGQKWAKFCDKDIRNRSLNRIFELDPEATQIIHGVIAVKYGISK